MKAQTVTYTPLSTTQLKTLIRKQLKTMLSKLSGRVQVIHHRHEVIYEYDFEDYSVSCIWFDGGMRLIVTEGLSPTHDVYIKHTGYTEDERFMELVFTHNTSLDDALGLDDLELF